MKKLWIAFIVLAALGSIYPFDFEATRLDAEALGAFMQSWRMIPSRGDILGNVLLFVPIGFAGMIALHSGNSARRSLAFVCLVGTFVALASQVTQIFLPSRDESLQDVFWNLTGTVGGAAAAIIIRRVPVREDDEIFSLELVPVTLIGAWLIYQLIPFVPSIDLKMIKDSLKPLLDLHLAPVSIIHEMTAWVIVAYLLRHARPSADLDSKLPVLIVTVLGLQVLIVDNSIDLSDIVGASMALLIWRGMLGNVIRPEVPLAILLSVTVLVAGLAPFEVAPESVSFSWLPFRVFLGGSMYLNAQSAAEKVFLYGGLVYLLWRTGASLYGGILSGVILVGIVELAQTRLIGHTPEITDPLLVVFAAITMLVVQNHEAKLATNGRQNSSIREARSEVEARPLVESKGRQENWVRQVVNLREYQAEFVGRLSQEMKGSNSGVIRRIVDEFITSLEIDSGSTLWTQRKESNVTNSAQDVANNGHGGRRERWVAQSVNFTQDQHRFLHRLSRKMDISISRVTRRIISRFIDEPDE
jgi:hypothetical protein